MLSAKQNLSATCHKDAQRGTIVRAAAMLNKDAQSQTYLYRIQVRIDVEQKVHLVHIAVSANS